MRLSPARVGFPLFLLRIIRTMTRSPRACGLSARRMSSRELRQPGTGTFPLAKASAPLPPL